MEMVKIKVCPNCGGRMKFIEEHFSDSGELLYYYECLDCIYDENLTEDGVKNG